MTDETTPDLTLPTTAAAALAAGLVDRAVEIPLHVDHEGNPTGCRHGCGPSELVHEFLLYGEPFPVDARLQTAHGPATVLSSVLCEDCPPSPNNPGRDPVATTVRFDHPPITTARHPDRYVWRIPDPYSDDPLAMDAFHAVDPRNDRVLCAPGTVLPGSHRNPGRGDARCADCLDLIVAAQTADAGDIDPPGTMHDRAPEVTVELQLRPPVPPSWRPHWWGNAKLSFYPPGATRAARTFDLWPLVNPDRHRARVRRHGVFGYVLVLTYTHDQARDALAKLTLPDHVTDAAGVMP